MQSTSHGRPEALFFELLHFREVNTVKFRTAPTHRPYMTRGVYVAVIIRCGWGRYAWSLSMRGAPRCAPRGGAACARPVPMAEPPARPAPACRALPAPPACAVDSAFPSLDAVLRQLNDPEAPTLFRLLEQQAALEKRVREAEDNVVRLHFYTHFPNKYFKYENF